MAVMSAEKGKNMGFFLKREIKNSSKRAVKSKMKKISLHKRYTLLIHVPINRSSKRFIN
jgi:hypothetical protein